MCKAHIHYKTITWGGLSIPGEALVFGLQVILQLEMSRDQTCNLSTAASPTKQRVNSLHYYS